jgi:hypothetical protein
MTLALRDASNATHLNKQGHKFPAQTLLEAVVAHMVPPLPFRVIVEDDRSDR